MSDSTASGKCLRPQGLAQPVPSQLERDGTAAGPALLARGCGGAGSCQVADKSSEIQACQKALRASEAQVQELRL